MPSPAMLLRLALIFAGGGAGSVLRYLVGGWVQGGKPGFPLGTLVVNLTGCLAIGFLAGLFSSPRLVGYENVRFAIIIGVLGGYTTFSSFGLETINLTYEGQFLYASLNILLSVALGLAAVWAGRQAVLVLYGP